jgi:cell division protein FtsB
MNAFYQSIFISIILFSVATFIVTGIIYSDGEKRIILLQNQIISMTDDMNNLSHDNANLRQMNNDLREQIEDYERREAQLMDCGYPD